MRDLDGKGFRGSTGANEKHSNFPQFYKIKHTDDPKKNCNAGYLSTGEIELAFQEAHALLGNERPDPLGWASR